MKYEINKPGEAPEMFTADTWCDAMEQYLALHPEIPAFPRTLPNDEPGSPVRDLAGLTKQTWLPEFAGQEVELPVPEDPDAEPRVPVVLELRPIRT